MQCAGWVTTGEGDACLLVRVAVVSLLTEFPGLSEHGSPDRGQLGVAAAARCLPRVPPRALLIAVLDLSAGVPNALFGGLPPLRRELGGIRRERLVPGSQRLA